MAIGKRLRFEILKRDGFRCRYCGKEASESTKLEVDHVVPRSKGGSDDPTNLGAACYDCNRGKTNKSVTYAWGDPRPPIPTIDRMVDNALDRAQCQARFITDLAEDRVCHDCDLLEFYFPLGLPEGFM